MALIFGISSLSTAPIPNGMTDHSGHIIGYAILGALMVRGLAGASWSGMSVTRGAGAVLLSVLYGLTDEWHQSFVPGRSPAWDDVAADAVGAGLGAAFVLILHIINKLWPTRT
jgi:VanZ family protein